MDNYFYEGVWISQMSSLWVFLLQVGLQFLLKQSFFTHAVQQYYISLIDWFEKKVKRGGLTWGRGMRAGKDSLELLNDRLAFFYWKLRSRNFLSGASILKEFFQTQIIYFWCLIFGWHMGWFCSWDIQKQLSGFLFFLVLDQATGLCKVQGWYTVVLYIWLWRLMWGMHIRSIMNLSFQCPTEKRTNLLAWINISDLLYERHALTFC